jgi:hypothetical protein
MTYQQKRDVYSVLGFIIGVLLGALVCTQCGCAQQRPPAICETACGLRLIAPPPPQDVYDGGSVADSTAFLPWWTCENLNAIEAQSLQALYANAAPYDDRFEPHAACGALDGVTLTIRPERHWFDGTDAGYFGNDKWVVGLTQCRGAPHPSIQLANGEPANGVLTHEMAHAIQDCHPKGPFPLPGVDPDYDADSEQSHLNWSRFGIYAAESQVQLMDAAERLRRENAIEACDGGAVCMQSFDAGVIP